MVPENFENKYKIILDKGTFDAICLNPDVVDQSEIRSVYMKNVHDLLQDDGRFVISSCNWTSAEMTKIASECKL